MSEEKSNKKIVKRIAIIAAILIGLAAIGFGAYYFACKSTMDSKIDDKNGDARQCLKSVGAYVEEYFSKDGGVPDNKDYYVRGETDGDGLVSDPCELIQLSFKIPELKSDDGKVYWVVKFHKGKAYEAWVNGEKLSNRDLIPYSKEKQREEYNKNVFKGADNVIGYAKAGD